MPKRAEMAAKSAGITRVEQLQWFFPGIDLINARGHQGLTDCPAGVPGLHRSSDHAGWLREKLVGPHERDVPRTIAAVRTDRGVGAGRSRPPL